jgi:uncharacterized repeat protein (TIGR03803 family)
MIKDNILYGTASEGGEGGEDGGTVFSLTPDGAFSLLCSFTGQSGDGAAWPFGGLVAGKKGTLYGTTARVDSETYGTVFRLAADGTETLLHTFSGGKDGSDPVATLAIDGFGNLYGTARSGGSTKGACAPDGCGTVFRVTP